MIKLHALMMIDSGSFKRKWLGLKDQLLEHQSKIKIILNM